MLLMEWRSVNPVFGGVDGVLYIEWEECTYYIWWCVVCYMWSGGSVYSVFVVCGVQLWRVCAT